MRISQLIFLSLPFLGWYTPQNNWITEDHLAYSLRYNSIDTNDLRAYENLIDNGITEVQDFFDSPFINKFDIAIHPSRQSLDSTWQNNWNLPTFKSECWMVASGVAFKMDLLSPKDWKDEACEHDYSDIKKTQQLITHELIHVFHGQFNPSPDFNNVEGLDWFIEGLATYASGQCDPVRLSQIKKSIANNTTPKNLDGFWTGNLKYGLSGSLVMYIDKKYGREKLKKLITFTKKSEILAELNISEKALLIEWYEFVQRQ